MSLDVLFSYLVKDDHDCLTESSSCSRAHYCNSAVLKPEAEVQGAGKELVVDSRIAAQQTRDYLEDLEMYIDVGSGGDYICENVDDCAQVTFIFANCFDANDAL